MTGHDREGAFSRRDEQAIGPFSASPTLGEMLRRARQAQGLTLADVERELRIRRRQILAMEEDRFGELASAVHAKGLLRVYARRLNLDPDEVVALLDADRYWVQPSGVVPAARHDRPSQSSLFGVVAMTAVALLIAGLGYTVVQQYATLIGPATSILASDKLSALAAQPTTEPSPTFAPTSSAAQPAMNSTPVATSVSANAPVAVATPTPTSALPTATPTSAPSPTATPTPTTRQPVEIEAEATGRVWLQVEVDGAVVFQGVLVAGDRRTWTGQREVFLWIGNAGYLNVIRNGKPEEQLGAAGQVVQVRWTAE